MPSELTVELSASLEVYVAKSIPYLEVLAWQRRRVQLMQQDPSLPDALLLVTHPPVYTLGQGSDPSYVKFQWDSPDHDIHRVERGGEVTYHGPGQWVGYPILNLNRHQKDLHWYLRSLEQVIINVLAEWTLRGERIPGLTGVWVQDLKVAAIGIKVSKWITFHGFCLNVCPNLSAYEVIVPCGITDRGVGSLVQFRPEVSMEQVQRSIINQFFTYFQQDPSWVSLAHWLRQDPK